MYTETIEVEVWEPNPEKPGYLKQVGTRTIEEVFEQVKARIPKDLMDHMDYFMYSSRDGKNEMPCGRWISAYPVIGDNEGHYVHVDVIAIYDPKTGQQTKEREHIYTAKTFDGFDTAAEFATLISRMFNDWKYYQDGKIEIYARHAIIHE
jgi:hypothetical protein